MNREELTAQADRLQETGERLIEEAEALRLHADERLRKRYVKVNPIVAEELAKELREFTGPEYQRKLQRKLGISYGAAGKALERLETNGVIENTRLRRQSKDVTGGALAYVFKLVAHKPESNGTGTVKRLPVKTPEELAVEGFKEHQPRGRVVANVSRPKLTDPDLNRLFQRALDTGVRWRKQGHHYKVYPKDGGPPVSFSGSPSDHRTFANTEAELKRRRVLADT